MLRFRENVYICLYGLDSIVDDFFWTVAILYFSGEIGKKRLSKRKFKWTFEFGTDSKGATLCTSCRPHSSWIVGRQNRSRYSREQALHSLSEVLTYRVRRSIGCCASVLVPAGPSGLQHTLYTAQPHDGAGRLPAGRLQSFWIRVGKGGWPIPHRLLERTRPSLEIDRARLTETSSRPSFFVRFTDFRDEYQSFGWFRIFVWEGTPSEFALAEHKHANAALSTSLRIVCNLGWIGFL